MLFIAGLGMLFVVCSIISRTDGPTLNQFGQISCIEYDSKKC